MLTETDLRIETMGDQLRAKINSKFQVAALLAGFAFTVLCLQIDKIDSTSLKSPLILAASIVFMVAAIVLFIFSIMRLDALTMPKKLWDRNKYPKHKPVAADYLWVLTERELWRMHDMMFLYWTRLTRTGIYLMAISMVLLLFQSAVVIPNGKNEMWIFVVTAIISVLLSGYYSHSIGKKAMKDGGLMRIVD